MNVTLIEHTPNPEKVVAAAAKLCYDKKGKIKDLMDGLTPEKIDKFVNHLASIGHGSPFEHITFTFGIEGVSRALSHQLVRHRAGASYSQRSQRYCSEDNFVYVTPRTVANHKEGKELFDKTIEDIRKAYETLIELGIPKEDARALLPNATATSMVVTMNARELLHFFNLRCCTRAQMEIRLMALEMLQLVKKVAPSIFRYGGPSCVKGYCPEGSMGCGVAPTLDELIKKHNGINK